MCRCPSTTPGNVSTSTSRIEPLWSSAKLRICACANLISSIVCGATLSKSAAISFSERRKLGGDHLSNRSDISRTAASPRLATSAMTLSTMLRILASAASCWPANAALLMCRDIASSYSTRGGYKNQVPAVKTPTKPMPGDYIGPRANRILTGLPRALAWAIAARAHRLRRIGPIGRASEGAGLAAGRRFSSGSLVSPGRRGSRLGRGADRDFLDLAADEGLVFAEIGLEALGQAARGLVIGLLVGPGAARVEHLVRHLGAAFRHEKAEIRLLADRRRGETAVERGAQ